MPRDRLGEVLDALDGFEFFAVAVPRRGLVTQFDHAGQGFENSHQTWVRDPATGLWRLDVFSEPSEGGTWICRRDERIRVPYDEMIEWTPDAIPYGRPEVMLLFKAKRTRPKDDDDFAAALPQLGSERRRWLAQALELVHPGHRWLTSLKTA